MKTKKRIVVHPGDILMKDYIIPLGLSQRQLARDLHIPAARINLIIQRRRRITADTALRLARYFETTPQFWMDLQSNYDLSVAININGEKINEEVNIYREKVKNESLSRNEKGTFWNRIENMIHFVGKIFI